MKKYILILSLLLVAGCAVSRAAVTVPKVVLLPEDRIYTVPAGQVMKVVLDGKPLEMTFPTEMKLVHQSVLVRQEQNLNDAILKKAKAETNRNQWVGILGSICSVAVGVIATISKTKGKST